ncbi:TPA: hypothetical protein N0F65_001149 [Lagenidium giganteum]|uniref:glucan endo-1,3-beta-D-glucosidase n=1 Tax=Lagenidium giganteum TaxID=4803 RepID=A0AAV2YXC4_9STRA|nr:TPA: hypothetical protein N0F65_001149 [Lagenidium giganteum]
MFQHVIVAAAALASAVVAATNRTAGTCYSPFHLQAYPLHGDDLAADGIANLQSAMDKDFKTMSQHFTHVRTYYSQFHGTSPAKSAAAAGVKLYLGVFMTEDGWQDDEIDAAVQAVKNYPDTVEAILVGSQNLPLVSAERILEVVNDIKSKLGADADKVKFGTAQRITEYLDDDFNDRIALLERNLDILGVNIYPFFSAYDPTKPESELQAQWDMVTAKYPLAKLRLTETGFTTAGGPSITTRVKPSLTESVKYYNAFKSWSPPGTESSPKFWFMTFDRRPDDASVPWKNERHFGFFTHDGQAKVPEGGYPAKLTETRL